MVLVSRRPGDDAWRFREACPDVLRAGWNPSHVWSEKQARVQWMNAAMRRRECGRFVRFGRSRGQDEKSPRQNTGSLCTALLEDGKLPIAGISQKPCPRKHAEEKGEVFDSVEWAWATLC